MGLCVTEVSWAIARERPISNAESEPTGAAYGVWGCLRNPPGLELFRRSKKDNRDLLLISRSVPGAALSPAARSAPMPWPRNCCARSQAISMANGDGKPAKVCALEMNGWPHLLRQTLLPSCYVGSHSCSTSMALVGSDLLASPKELGDGSKSDLVRSCRFTLSTKERWPGAA